MNYVESTVDKTSYSSQSLACVAGTSFLRVKEEISRMHHWLTNNALRWQTHPRGVLSQWQFLRSVRERRKRKTRAFAVGASSQLCVFPSCGPVIRSAATVGSQSQSSKLITSARKCFKLACRGCGAWENSHKELEPLQITMFKLTWLSYQITELSNLLSSF